MAPTSSELPSMKAAERLGFQREGLFRKHMFIRGRSRDTLWYAVIDDQWEELKARLVSRLAGLR